MALSEEQLNNWRNVLYGIIGPVAVFLPDSEIQEMCDSMSEKLSKMEIPGAEYLSLNTGDMVWVDGTTKAYVKEVGRVSSVLKMASGGLKTVVNERIKLEKS